MLDKGNHYVYIGSTIYKGEIEHKLLLRGFEKIKDFACIENIDRINYFGALFNFDRIIDGRVFGKAAYCNSTDMYFRYIANIPVIKSVGRFTSIAAKVSIHGNHKEKRLYTGDLRYWIPTEIRKNLYGYTHDEEKTFMEEPNSIEIGNDVWIGENTFINCSRVQKIGDGAIIGTGAVVLDDVPPYAVVVGVPGKIKKYRYTPEQIDCLLQVHWWNWSDEERDKYAECLFNPQLFFDTFM